MIKVLSACAVTVLLALLGLYECGYRINMTASMPKGIYRVVPGEPTRGDIVAYCLPPESKWTRLARERGYLGQGMCPSGLQPLLKILAAVGGDEVLIDSEGVTIKAADYERRWDGPMNRKVDSRGRALPKSDLKAGQVPMGLGLLLAGHTGSYDGRYFGFVQINEVQCVNSIMQF